MKQKICIIVEIYQMPVKNENKEKRITKTSRHKIRTNLPFLCLDFSVKHSSIICDEPKRKRFIEKWGRSEIYGKLMWQLQMIMRKWWKYLVR